MRWPFPSLLLFGILSVPATAAELLPVKINGLEADKTLEEAVRRALALSEAQDGSESVSEGRLGYYLSNINRMVEDSLEPLGYYQPTVSSYLKRDGTQVQIIVDVLPGQAVMVRDLSLRMDGDAGKDRFIGFWLEGFAPVHGAAFNHGQYEQSKADIGQALLDRGYFDQRNSTHEVRITRALHSADIDLSWDSGIRYRYGAVRFEGHRFVPGLLDQLVNFEPGAYYSQPQINRLQESLAKLNYFSSIEIVPELERKEGDRVPVLVNLTQGKRSSQHASVRYGTQTGLGLEYGVERGWINRRGHKLDINTGIAQNEQSFSALYRIPAFQWLDGWYGIGLIARTEEYSNTSSHFIEGAFSRSGEFRNWDLRAGLNIRRERFDEGIPNVDPSLTDTLYTAVLYPEFSAIWRRGDDPLYPSNGSSWHYLLRAGYEFEASHQPFVQVAVKNKWIHSMSDANRMILRGELGAIWSGQFATFPPSMSFYAGGDQSVRGYGYKEIGEYYGKYNFGGRYLAVASVEYEHRLNKQWAVASFMDVGDAFDRTPTANFGVGAGARWRSPIGPVRFDIAYGFNGPDPGFGLHFTIGSDL